MLHPSPPCHVLSPPFFLSCNKACDPAGVAVVCSQFVNTLSSLGGAVYGTDFSLFSGFEVLMSEPSAAASGGAIFLTGKGQLYLQDSEIMSAYGILSGGAIAATEFSSVVFNTVTVRNCTSTYGAGMYMFDTSSLDCTSCNFVSNTVLGNGGALFLSGSSLSQFSLSYFYRNTAFLGGGAIFSTSDSYAWWYNSSFIQNSAGLGGAFWLEATSHVLFPASKNATTLLFNTASSGGAIYMLEFSQVALAQCIAAFNVAQSGSGGLISSSSNGTIIAHDIKATSNSAWNGGAIALNMTAPSLDPDSNIPLQLTGSEFVNNLANDTDGVLSQPSFGAQSLFGGGALFFQAPSSLLQTSSSSIHAVTSTASFLGNFARYGPHFASSPFSVVQSSSKGIPTTALRTSSPVAVVPGLEWHTEFTIVDVMGQNVTTVTGFTVQANCELCDNPVTYFSSSNGSVVIRFSTKVEGPRNISASVSGFSSSLFPQADDTIPMQIQTCPEGYGYNPSFGCRPCDRNSFSVDNPNFPQTCIQCTSCGSSSSSSAPCFESSSVQCLGGSAFVVQSGFWTFPLDYYKSSSDYVIQTFRCPFDYCNHNGFQSPGHLCLNGSHRVESSPLCGQCEAGHSEWSNTCVPCDGVDAGAVVALLFKMWGLAILSHLLSQGKAVASTKMLLFVVQTGPLIFYPDITLLSFQRVIQFALPQFGSACPFPVTGLDELLIDFFSSLSYFAFLWLSWLLHKLLVLWLQCANPSKPSWMQSWARASARENYIRSSFVLVLGVYQNVLQIAFTLFTCQQVGDKSYVFLIPSIECTDKNPRFFAQRLVFGFLFALLCLIPIGIFFLMRWFSTHPKHIQRHYMKLEPLFMNFRAPYWWWEAYQITRRLVIVILFYPMASSSQENILPFSLCLAFAAFLLIHCLVQPYQDQSNNVFETMALSSLVFCSLVFSSKLDSNTQVILCIVILAVTSAFLLYPPARRLYGMVVKLGRSAGTRCMCCCRHRKQQSTPHPDISALQTRLLDMPTPEVDDTEGAVELEPVCISHSERMVLVNSMLSQQGDTGHTSGE